MPRRSPERPRTAGHYFDRAPVAPPRPRTVTLDLPDVHLELAADSAVFSADRVDPGTKLLLLEGPDPVPAGNVVDLGCGYGAIACTLASRSGATVWAVDVNDRALDLCRRNAEAAGLAERVRVSRPDDVPADLRFDQLWSNPPIRIGKPALHEMLATWLDRLTGDAAAVLVVQKHLGADSLASWLEGQGWPTTRLRSRMGYRLLEVRQR